ncbi:hypothetical protein WA158_008191 [Blastocystis sp. Blastoise]
METTEFQLNEEKYLFSFQDETQLWIPVKVIENYRELPFYDIIKHSDKYDDGSYYIDMLPLHMKDVIQFLMEDNIDISSMSFKDSADICETLDEYSVDIKDDKLQELSNHVEQIVISFLKENHYKVYFDDNDDSELTMPMEIFSYNSKVLKIDGLTTSEKREKLLCYSHIFKQINITTVFIEYQYSSTIPLEYICPSNIKEIFPALEKLKITVNVSFEETDIRLNPFTDEYMEQFHFFVDWCRDKEWDRIAYEMFTKSEIRRYQLVNNNDIHRNQFSKYLLDRYDDLKSEGSLPRLYENKVEEALYNQDYSKLEKTYERSELTKVSLSLKYEKDSNNVSLDIPCPNIECGFSQLLQLPIYSSISYVSLPSVTSKSSAEPIIKAFQKGYFDSLTELNLSTLEEYVPFFCDYRLSDIITSHIFPDITELHISNKDKQSSLLCLVNKTCFPKLHIITYDSSFNSDVQETYSCLLPHHLLSFIDTINVPYDSSYIKYAAPLLDDLASNYNIHINNLKDGIFYFPNVEKLLANGLISLPEKFEINSNERIKTRYIDAYMDHQNQEIKNLSLAFSDYDDDNDEYMNEMQRRRLYYTYIHKEEDEDIESFHKRVDDDLEEAINGLFQGNTLKHLQEFHLEIYDVSEKRMKWIESLFNIIPFESLSDLYIRFPSDTMDIKSNYFLSLKTIIIKLIPKASTIFISNNNSMDIYGILISEGFFHNTNQLTIDFDTFDAKSFFDLYTKQNFPKLKKINIKIQQKNYISLFDTFSEYINKDTLPSSTICFKDTIDKVYSKNNKECHPLFSLLQCKDLVMTSLEVFMSSWNLGPNVCEYEINLLMKYIKEKKVPNMRNIVIAIRSTEILSQVINLIITDQIPKLREIRFELDCHTQINYLLYVKQLKNSEYVKDHHILYEFCLGE